MVCAGTTRSRGAAEAAAPVPCSTSANTPVPAFGWPATAGPAPPGPGLPGQRAARTGEARLTPPRRWTRRHRATAERGRHPRARQQEYRRGVALPTRPSAPMRSWLSPPADAVPWDQSQRKGGRPRSDHPSLRRPGGGRRPSGFRELPDPQERDALTIGTCPMSSGIRLGAFEGGCTGATASAGTVIRVPGLSRYQGRVPSPGATAAPGRARESGTRGMTAQPEPPRSKESSAGAGLPTASLSDVCGGLPRGAVAGAVLGAPLRGRAGDVGRQAMASSRALMPRGVSCAARLPVVRGSPRLPAGSGRRSRGRPSGRPGPWR